MKSGLDSEYILYKIPKKIEIFQNSTGELILLTLFITLLYDILSLVVNTINAIISTIDGILKYSYY